MAETALENLGESGRTVIGNEVVHVAAAAATPSAVSGVGASAAATGAGYFSAFGVTIAAGVSLILNQINYDKKLANLRGMYSDEVGQQLGKAANKVTNKDLELVAKGDASRGIPGNKTIADALSKFKTRRNVGMLVTTAAILGTLAFLSVTGLSGAAIFGSSTFLAGAGTFAVKALMGFAIHSALEKPMHWVSKKIFRMEDTTQDIISDLRKQHRNGNAISREQIVGVFVSANKELDQFVKSQFGKDYDDLSVQQKRAVADSFEQYLPVTSLTEKINAGHVKITELAFAVEGQNSGVAPDTVKDNLSIVGKARHVIEEHKAHTPPKRKVVEYDNPAPSRSFASRIEAERTTGPRALN